MSAELDPGAALSWLTAHRDDLIAELVGWVRIRSVVGPPEHEIDLRRSANWLAGRLRDLGFPTVELWPTGSTTTVWAEWCAAPGAPTVLVYSHHDVRAAKDELWEQCPPFEPAMRDGRIYGRGTSDAKGQVLAHLWGLRAFLADGHDAPPVNLKLLVEGQEEVGSPDLADVLDRHADRLAADFVVLSDTMTWSADRPAMCVGVRGLMQAQLEMRGPHNDVHAGAVSGVAPNPATALATVLAALRNECGRVSVPGFYDDVRELSDEERAELTRLGSDEDDWLDRTHTRAVVGEAGRSLGERLYGRPTVEVVSLLSGDPVGPSRGTIPAVAHAVFQFSLVPDQDPGAIGRHLREWLAATVPDGVDYELTLPGVTDQPAYVTPPDHPALPVLQQAMADAWGTDVGRMRNAGSAPTFLLAEKVGSPVLFFGTGLPEDRWHSSDESVHVETLLRGAATMALFWPRLAASWTSPG